MKIILVSLLFLISLDHVNSVLPRLHHTVKAETITPLFKILDKYGQKEIDRAKASGERQWVRQFIALTVVSEKEIQSAAQWNGVLPDKLQDKRFVVKLNELKKPQTHGEIQVLYSDIIPKMIQVLHDEEGKDEFPYAVLFSLYIPCANVENVKYSCAEELGHVARKNLEKYQMLVGFKEIFPKTNDTLSKQFMMDGFIQAFTFELNNAKYVSLYNLGDVPLASKNDMLIFQAMLFHCLSDSEISECCTHDPGNQNDVASKAKLTAYYVNMMAYECTKDSNQYGRLTERNRYILNECITKYINDNTGNDCNICKLNTKKTKTLLLQFCTLNSYELATRLGQPVDRYDAYEPTWKPFERSWKDAYVKDYDKEVKNRPPVFCFKGTNSGKSLCTLQTVSEKLSDIKDHSEKKDVRKSAKTVLRQIMEGTNRVKKNKQF